MAKGFFNSKEKMNNILVKKMEDFIALNPYMVDAVLTDYGVSKEVPLTVETIFSAFRLFGEGFARDLYEAVKNATSKETTDFKSADASATTETQSTDTTGFSWDAFFSFLTGAVNASPEIINAANGNTFPYGSYPNVNVPGYYPSPTTSSINILMYVAIAVAIIVALIVVFKKA